MARDVDAAVARLTRQLQSLTRTVHALRAGSRTQRLPHSSLETGQSIELVDGETGATRGRIGWQPDGTVAVVTEGGDPVSAPTAPSVTPSLGGLRVTWDGTLANELALPADFDHMAVHVSTSAGFSPSASTYVGSIRRAGEGGMLPVVPLPYVEHYVVLVPVTTGGVQGAPSAEASGTPLQSGAADLEAGSVHAVHIQAGAVEADKLEAVLALVTTIIAGIPGAARVELDQDGLRGYNEANELIFAIDSSGSAVFSGTITASEIVGSRMELGTSGVATGEIQDQGGIVQARVTSATDARAQLSASSTQADFAAFGNVADLTSPVAGFIGTPGHVSFVLNSDNSDIDNTPGLQGTATLDQAWLTVTTGRSAGLPEITQLAVPTGVTERWGSGGEPLAQVSATPSGVTHTWQSNADTSITITALVDQTRVSFTVPAPAEGSTPASGATLYGFRSATGDQPQVALQSPFSTSGTGANRRSSVTLTGAQGASYPTARALIYGNEVLVANDFDATTSAFSTDLGQLRLASTHAINSARMRPVTGRYLSTPVNNTSGAWLDFTAGQWERPSFRSPPSGVVRVDIAVALQSAHATASMAIGYRIIDADTSAVLYSQTVRNRCAYAGGLATVTTQVGASHYVTVTPNKNCILIPQWWKTSQDWGTNWSLWSDYENHITVTPQT